MIPPGRPPQANGLRCIITYAPEHRKGLPSDFFEGVIERFDSNDPNTEGELLSSVEGSWVGFVDFDQVCR